MLAAMAKTCSIEGCKKPHKARGWCSRHYRCWWESGDPRRGDMTPGERVWLKVNKDGPVPAHRPDLGPCWPWTGCTSPSGYGTIGVRYKVRRAHVVAYEQLVGPVPDGLELDHLCRVRACCNPAHMEPVTHAENMRRGVAGKVAAIRQRGKAHCPQGHPYDETNTYVSPRGSRSCRTCRRAAEQVAV